MTPQLPKRRITRIETISNVQNYSNLKNIKSEDYDKVEIVSLKYQDIIADLDYFKYFLLNFHNLKKIHCDCYECLIIINDLLSTETDILISLLDDGIQRDRSYINLERLDKLQNISLPISYVMWNINVRNEQPVSCYIDGFRNICQAVSSNGNTLLKRETLLRIKDIVANLSGCSNLTDIEKTLIISDYLQSKVKHVSDEDLRELTGLVETTLFKNYGLCMGIANATTLLSNNPIFDLNTRTIFGSGHAWNIQTMDGKDYYIDNTWNITRNPNKFEETLKAREFTTKYTLFGRDTAKIIGHHISESIILRKVNIAEKDYDQQELERVGLVLKRKKLINFNYTK